MSLVLDVITVAGGAVALLHGGYWSLLSAAALKRPSHPASAAASRLRVAVLVPAHNEERGIVACVASLFAGGARPGEVVVVADNCTDATADVARAFGTTVVERHDPGNRGKPFALDAGLAHLRTWPEPPDAVLFVDADTTVNEDFVAAMAGAIGRGASVAQAHYGVATPETGLQRLRGLALALVHWARPLGASRLGLGTSLKGNGMALRWGLVRDGFPGRGITEDAALTLELARGGIPVAFVPGATAWGQMASTYSDATTQDRRWEGGRLSLSGQAFSAAAQALARRRPAAAAGALEVAALPLTLAGVAAAMSVAAAMASGGLGWLAGAGVASLLLYVALGWAAARVPVRSLVALVEAPRFVAHKLRTFAALAARRGPTTWERTARR